MIFLYKGIHTDNQKIILMLSRLVLIPGKIIFSTTSCTVLHEFESFLTYISFTRSHKHARAYTVETDKKERNVYLGKLRGTCKA